VDALPALRDVHVLDASMHDNAWVPRLDEVPLSEGPGEGFVSPSPGSVQVVGFNRRHLRQAVTFGAVRCSHEGAGHTFTCQAVAGECVVAELDVTFTRVD
jgi:hypothetical protein